MVSSSLWKIARAQQPFQLAAGRKLVVPPERGDHLLANLFAVTSALDDLQIGAPGRGLAAEVHNIRGSCAGKHGARDSRTKIKHKCSVMWHYVYAPTNPQM
jgi:hypothetical protein